ncbi:MAG TPA: hypothetical protein VF207_08900 [Chthoniobacterales bacterium]
MRTDEISVFGLLDKANASTTVFDHEVSHLVIDIDLPRVIVDDELRSTVVDLVSALLALQTLHRAASSLASKVTVWSSQSRSSPSSPATTTRSNRGFQLSRRVSSSKIVMRKPLHRLLPLQRNRNCKSKNKRIQCH